MSNSNNLPQEVPIEQATNKFVSQDNIIIHFKCSTCGGSCEFKTGLLENDYSIMPRFCMWGGSDAEWTITAIEKK